MAKLEQLKERIRSTQTKIQEKIDSNPFLQKIRERRANKADGPSKDSLGDVYKAGSFRERVLIIILYFFLLLSLGATAYFLQKTYSRIANSREQKDLRKNYATGFNEIQDKAREAASVVSLGKVLVNGYGREKHGFMSLDLWVRCSDPEAAAFAQSNDVILRDKAVQALTELTVGKDIDFLSESGKATTHDAIRKAMNTALHRGSIEEVFFHNLVIQ